MGRHSAPNSSRRTKPALVAAPLAAVVLLGGGLYLAQERSGGDSSATSSGCSQPTHVRVTAPVEIGPTIRALTAKYATDKDTCVAYDVSEQEAQTTARGIAVGAPDTPQIWITDSPMFVERVNQTRKDKLTAGPSVATSPIGIAVPPVLAKSGQVPTGRQSFVDLFRKSGGKLPLQVADLDTSSSSLLGTTVAMGATGNDPQASLGLARTMVGISQSWSTDAQLQLQGATAGEKAVMWPASEQQMFAVSKNSKDGPVKAMSFTEGDPVLDYRVVPVTGSSAPTDAQVADLTKALTSKEGQAKLEAAGFRVGDSTGPGVEGISGSPAKPAPMTLDQVDTTVRVTDAVGLDMSLLTVMDVTGSMKEKAIGDLNRAQVATQAVQKAVELFPEQTRFGLWEFAAGINGPGRPNYRELLPIAPLDAKVQGTTQKRAVQGALGAMPGHLKGGTPLYETILAAYKAAQAKAVPNQTSAMVLVTDGKDEDYKGLTKDGLLTRLAQATDPKRPVKVILVGIGQQADMPTLRAIAKATGGAAYNASNPADIPNVVFDALAQRVTVATEL